VVPYPSLWASWGSGAFSSGVSVSRRLRADSAELALQFQQVGPPGAVSPQPGSASYVPVGAVADAEAALSCGLGFTCGRMSRVLGSLGPWRLGPGVILERVRVLSVIGQDA
jgi:hypothetical protein